MGVTGSQRSLVNCQGVAGGGVEKMEVKSEKKKVRGKDQKLGSRWGVPGVRRKIQPFSPEASDVVPDSDVSIQHIQSGSHGQPWKWAIQPPEIEE